jgi:hypothetical protein
VVRLVNFEAKLFNLLSKGVKNAPFSDQAAKLRPIDLRAGQGVNFVHIET